MNAAPKPTSQVAHPAWVMLTEGAMQALSKPELFKLYAAARDTMAGPEWAILGYGLPVKSMLLMIRHWRGRYWASMRRDGKGRLVKQVTPLSPSHTHGASPRWEAQPDPQPDPRLPYKAPTCADSCNEFLRSLPPLEPI